MKRAFFLACLLALPNVVEAQGSRGDSRAGVAADRAFRSCRTWCEVSIEGAQAIPGSDSHAPDAQRPELWLSVRVRNLADTAMTLNEDVLSFQATDSDLPQMGDVAVAAGPWMEPGILGARTFPVIQPGQSFRVYYRFWRLPEGARTIHLKVGGQFVLGSQAWAAPPMMTEFRELERNLFLDAKLPYIPSHLPAPQRIDDFLGEWDKDGQRVVVTREGPKVIVRTLHAHGAHQNRWEFGLTPNPARLLTPETGLSRHYMSHDPRGYLQIGHDGQTLSMSFAAQSLSSSWTARRISAPAQEPQSGGQPAPGPAPQPQPVPDPAAPAETGGFQNLGAFEVRFDELERPRGSTVVRARVTVRNSSNQVQHLPSGTFRAILTDADGVGQERNQLWRGSGEPAQLFNGTPTLQPGGELTVRFTFNPDNRDLDSLVLMRGQEQVEFDMAGR